MATGVPGWLSRTRNGQLALVKGEDQPDTGLVQAGAGIHGIGDQLADQLGRVRDLDCSPFTHDLPGPGAGTARRGQDRAQIEERARQPG